MTQPTTGRLDLSIWRNDDVYEFPLRVIGPNLTGLSMRAQIRPSGDNPVLLANLGTVTNGNAEGVRLASATLVDGRWVNDVRIRINKSTRQGLPYGGEIGSEWTGEWAFAISGQTRLVGSVHVPAHALDSDSAPLVRPIGYGSTAGGGQGAPPSSGATLTISGDGGATLVIDGADFIGQAAATVAAVAEQAAVSAALVQAIAGDVVAAVPINGNPNELRATVANAATVEFEILVVAAAGPGDIFLTPGDAPRLRMANGGGGSLTAADLPKGIVAKVVYSPGGAWVVTTTRNFSNSEKTQVWDPDLLNKPWGNVSIDENGNRVVSRLDKYVLVCGSSNAHAGFVPAAQLPGNVFVQALNENFLGEALNFIPDNQAAPGSPFVMVPSQADKSVPLKLGNVPFALLVYGMNDARTLYYHDNGGIMAEIASLRASIAMLRKKKVEPVLCTIFPPDPRASDVALDPDYYSSTAAYPGGGSTRGMDFPAVKAAPVSPENHMEPRRSQLTDVIDVTGSGRLRTIYKRIQHVNDLIRAVAAEFNCMCLDFEWSAYRNAIETVGDLSVGGLDIFYNKADPLHPKPALYQAAVTPVIKQLARAIAEGRRDMRLFRGDERFFDYDFTAGAANGAAMSRAAGPSTSRGASGALVKSTAADTMRFDYDPPVENRVADSRGGVFQIDSIGATITQTATTDGTKYVVSAVGQGQYAYSYLGDFPVPPDTQTFSVDLRGEVGGEVVWLMGQGTDGNWKGRKFTLTTAWQRFEVSATNRAFWLIGTKAINAEAGSPDEQPADAQTYYVRRRQLNHGPVALAYTETTGTPIYVPPVCRGVMLEPERTNYALNAERLSGWNSFSANAVVTDDAMSAPDGTLTADRLAIADGGYRYNGSTAVGTAFTATLFIRSDGVANVGFRADDAATGNPSSVGAAVTSASWQRFSRTLAGSSIRPEAGLDQRAFAGASGAVTIAAWGFQIEQGAVASSYIPTIAEAATRPAETLRLTVDASATGEVDLYYADGSFETRTGTLAGGVLSLPASSMPRVVSKARARRVA